MRSRMIYLAIFVTIFVQFCEPARKRNKCVTCSKRTFESEAKNVCHGNNFCDILKCGCLPCSSGCFKVWDGKIADAKDGIGDLTKDVLQKYAFTYDLEKFYKALDNEEVNIQIDEITSNVKNIDKLVIQIGTGLEELGNHVKERANNTDDQNGDLDKSLEKIQNDLDEIKKQIDVLKGEILEFDFNQNLDSNILNLSMSLLNVSNILSSFDDSFDLEGKDPLSLALSLESDLNQLEAILLKPTDNSTFNHDIKMKNLTENVNRFIKTIMEDLVTLFDNFGDIEKLVKSASSAEGEAKLVKEKVEEFLSKEKQIEDILNQNVTLEIEEILKDLQVTNAKMEKFEENAAKFRQIIKSSLNETQNIGKTFQNEYSRFKTLSNNYSNKLQILRLREETLEDLLQNVTIVTDTLKDYDKIKSVEEMTVEINKLTRDVEKYRQKFLEYCDKDDNSRKKSKLSNKIDT